MNENHARLCPSPEWARQLQSDVLPWLVAGVELGARMLEVGPGPGAATDWLRHRVERLVAVEYDRTAAQKLAVRFAADGASSSDRSGSDDSGGGDDSGGYGSGGGVVEVVNGDATSMAFGDASFDSAGCFTMLHHIPTAAAQNRLLAEVLRVLRPGGVLIGSDSLPSDRLHQFHEGDTYLPVEPSALLVRLQTVGFERITLRVDERLMFIAHKP